MGRLSIKNIFKVFKSSVFRSSVSHDTAVCRHLAVNSAILHKSENPKDEVELCLGYSEYYKEFHIQAKYRKPGGEWTFLKQPPQFTNWDGEQDDFDIKQSVSIEYWLRDHLRVLD